jgi:LmbE family N-acetylglucosaminyl deacetylase
VESGLGWAGKQEPFVNRSYNVVSPHLDDAALSASLFLAANPGSRVITVFASGPPSVKPLTAWDRAAKYFPEGADVAAIRRGEDISAAAMLGATSRHLRFWDRQYRGAAYGYDGEPEDSLPALIAEELLACAAEQPDQAWVFPLGLGHADHRAAADAGLLFARRQAGEVYVYEDLPYAAENPRGVAERKEQFTQRGFTLTEEDTLAANGSRSVKAAAIACHVSQRRLLGRRIRTAVRAPERIWRLEASQRPREDQV